MFAKWRNIWRINHFNEPVILQLHALPGMIVTWQVEVGFGDYKSMAASYSCSAELHFL